MKVAITGSHGTIGRALAASLVADGHEVVRLVRRAARAPDEAGYDPETDFFDPERVEGCRALVHLAGANPGARAWSDADRELYRKSRYEPTRKVCQNTAMLREMPEVIVSASSLAYYGSRPGEVLDERSPRGSGEWASFTEDWESAAEMVESVGMRLVLARFAAVLAPGAGLLGALERAAARGLGPQWRAGGNRVATVTLTDAVRALRHAIETPALHGPLVVAAPGAPTRAALAAEHLPARAGQDAPTPADARETLGDACADAWTADRTAEPRALLASGFRFGDRA